MQGTYDPGGVSSLAGDQHKACDRCPAGTRGHWAVGATNKRFLFVALGTREGNPSQVIQN